MGSYDIAIIGTLAGQNIVNSHGMTIADAFSVENVADAAIAAQRAFDAFRINFSGSLSSQYTGLRAEARGVLNAAVFAASSSASFQGQGNGAALPSFVAARVKLTTGTPGRAGRGRTGLPGLMEDQTQATAPNLLVPAVQTALANGAEAWRLQLKGTAPLSALSVVSRIVNGVKRTTPLVSEVLSTSVDSQLGTRVSRIR